MADRGLRQVDVGERLGRTQGWVSKLLAGHILPSGNVVLPTLSESLLMERLWGIQCHLWQVPPVTTDEPTTDEPARLAPTAQHGS